MTDMETLKQNLCMSIVFKVESVIRSFLQPEKINLASLGNITHIFIGISSQDIATIAIFLTAFGLRKKEAKKWSCEKVKKLN